MDHPLVRRHPPPGRRRPRDRRRPALAGGRGPDGRPSAPAAPAVAGRHVRRRGAARNVRQTGRTPGREAFQAYTEHAAATFITPAGKPPALGQLTYGPDTAYGFVPQDARQTLWAARKLVRDRRYVDALKLTPEQVAKVQQRTNPSMTATPADRAALAADFAVYHTAAGRDQAAARTKLLADLDAVADRSQAATRQHFADLATQINAIVTPAQWAQFKAMGGQP